jgi:FMN phosphatase YigB (HAD superfamily)
MLGVAKPDARFFLKICADQHVALCDALVVGDNFKTDILGAHIAGIDSCLISKVNTAHEIPSNSCIIPSILELTGVLK